MTAMARSKREKNSRKHFRCSLDVRAARECSKVANHHGRPQGEKNVNFSHPGNWD